MKLNTLLLVAEAIDTLATQLDLHKADIMNALEDKNLLTLEQYQQLTDYFLE